MAIIHLDSLIGGSGSFQAKVSLDVPAGETALGLHLDFALTRQGNVSGASSAGSPTNAIRIRAASHGLITGDQVRIEQVQGTFEANGDWIIEVVDSDRFDLRGSTWANLYMSGGTWSFTGNPVNETLWRPTTPGEAPPSTLSKTVFVKRGGVYECRSRLNLDGLGIVTSNTESTTVTT